MSSQQRERALYRAPELFLALHLEGDSTVLVQREDEQFNLSDGFFAFHTEATCRVYVHFEL